VTGAAPVPVEMLKRMRSELTFQTIVTGYGLTEATGIATMNRHDDPPELISSTDGRVISDVEVSVVDDDGVEVPRGTPGELLVRGYNVMAGDLDDPGATAEAIDADGWLHTGDLATVDAEGVVRITDRLTELIKVKGFQVAPAELEGLLCTHPAVADAAVIGVPDDAAGERPKAFVVARGSAMPDEVMTWMAERVAPHKRLCAVEVVDEIPKLPSGKILRRVLRDR